MLAFFFENLEEFETKQYTQWRVINLFLCPQIAFWNEIIDRVF